MLTGPTSLIWLPFFILRWIIGYRTDAKRESKTLMIVMMGLLSAGMNIYLSFFSKEASDIGSRLRTEMLWNFPKGFASMFGHLFASGGYPVQLAITASVVTGLALLTLYYHSTTRFKLLGFGSMIYYAFITTCLSFNMEGGSRYAIPISTAIFALTLLQVERYYETIFHHRNQWRKVVCIVTTMGLLMGSKVAEFGDFSGEFRASNYVYDQKWPNWKEQIEKLDPHTGGIVKTFPQWKDSENNGRDWTVKIPPFSKGSSSK